MFSSRKVLTAYPKKGYGEVQILKARQQFYENVGFGELFYKYVDFSESDVFGLDVVFFYFVAEDAFGYA